MGWGRVGVYLCGCGFVWPLALSAYLSCCQRAYFSDALPALLCCNFTCVVCMCAAWVGWWVGILSCTSMHILSGLSVAALHSVPIIL